MPLPAVTQTGIYNRTLTLLGSVSRTTNIDDGQPWTDTLNELWPMAVRELLAAHPWNCAIGRAVLNKGAAPEWGEGFKYQLPADCLRWLPPAADSEQYFRGVEEGGFLIADADDTLKIRYIRLVEDLTRWPPHLVTALAQRLAMDSAEALTQSSSIVEDMRVKYEGPDGASGCLAEAKRMDGLATGERDRGNVVTRSRALRAAMGGGCGELVPGVDY
jgi:hypothetical protein